MEEKPGHHQHHHQVARDLIPFMQLNLDQAPKSNLATKVTLQQQCYRLVPDLLPLSPENQPPESTTPLKHSTPVNVDVERRPKRRQLPQIPADKKPFEKLWQIGMSRLESSNENLERKNFCRWRLTKSNVHLEIKTDPTTGRTVSINIVDDDDDDDDEICDHKENAVLSSSSSLLSNVNDPPPTSLDWSLADQTPSSLADYGGVDSGEIMMHQTPTLQSSSSSRPPQPNPQRPTSSGKNSSDSGLSSSLDSPSVTLNDHKIENPGEPEPTHRALFKFCPRHPDEIDLQIGDMVHIHQEFDDQWSDGLNLRTGCRGIFPTALVIDLNYSEFVFENVDSTTASKTNGSWIDFRIQRERFRLDFLGSIEVFKAKGEDVLDESISRVANGVDGRGSAAKLGMEIPFHCWLEISDIGIRMSENGQSGMEPPANGKHDYFFALVQITYCGYQFKNNNNNLYYFAFITRHPSKQQRFACHVFRSFDQSTRDVAEAVGRAFHRFYNRFVQITLPTMDTTITTTTGSIIP